MPISRALNLQRARAMKRFKAANTPKLRKTVFTKKKFLKALRGTAGIKVHIAANLKVRRKTIIKYLKRPDWEDMREAYQDEVEAGHDAAKIAIRDAIQQRLDIGTAARTAQWLLSKVEREQYGDDKKVVVEGGDNPIKMLHGYVDIEKLNLPVDTMRTLLAALENSDQEGADAALASAGVKVPDNGTTTRVGKNNRVKLLNAPPSGR